MSTAISDSDLRHWQEWVGRTETRSQRLETESVRRFAAASDQDLDVDRSPPALMHWASFLPTAASDELGQDGHTKRGGFMPPVHLVRRMFAAATFEFEGALSLDEKAEQRSTILSVTHKRGQSGELIFVELERVLTQSIARVTERQTIVFRDSDAVTQSVAHIAALPEGEMWTPAAVDLFRFSAATFNSHRIHYDAPYATAQEAYPGLVVHGPLIATRLAALAQKRKGGALRRFSFRAQAPAFVDQPLVFVMDGDGENARAVRCDGATAMSAAFV